jgi:hypothetical protein
MLRATMSLAGGGGQVSDTERALDKVDDFITVGARMADLPIMREPDLRSVADALGTIAEKLLRANENMAGWLYGFAQFDFRQPNARGEFGKLVGEYKKAKAGGRLRAMKFHCGEIRILYDAEIADKLGALFPGEPTAMRETADAFRALGNADDDMVALIYNTVVAGIDEFIGTAENYVDHGEIPFAEGERLRFRVASGSLSERLERLATGLSDLALRYAVLAHRPVGLHSELVSG